MIEKGADVHHKKKGGRTTLMYAAHSNSVDLIRLLVEKGVDINVANDKGLTALMYTDDKDKNVPALVELLKQGTDINRKNIIGKTVLMRAALYGSLKIVECLLGNDADTSIVCDAGNDVLSYAEQAEQNSEAIITLLKKHGAKVLPFYCGYKAQMPCPECGQPIMINGPFQRIKCSACQSMISLDNELWDNFFESSTGPGGSISSLFGGGGLKLDYKVIKPCCSKCKSELDISGLKAGSEEAITCSKCDKQNNTFPAPAWMKKYTVRGMHPQQIFCAEREVKEGAQQAEGTKPIAIKCISCGAVLRIDMQTPRNSTCEHCDTVQYLPDPLWLSLHPVKKSEQWYIWYNNYDKLMIGG